MSKSKKLMSIFLACFLLLSCCSVGLVAFAEEATNTAPADAVVNETLTEESTEAVEEEEVTQTVQEYVELMKNKEYLTPEEKEALKDAQAKLVKFGLNCADVLTSPEAVSTYEQMYNTAVNAAGDTVSAVRAAAEEALSKAGVSADDLLNAMAAADTAEVKLPSLETYERTEVTYPKGATKDQVQKAIPKLDELLEKILPMVGVEGGLEGMIQTQLYTNKTAGALAKALFALGGMFVDNSKPYYAAQLAECLMICDMDAYADVDEEENYTFKLAVKKLMDFCDTYETEEDTAKIDAAWDALTFEDGDFLFKDGDKEGFKNTLAAFFRPYAGLAELIALPNSVDPETGDVKYGGYEGLIPILEMLDLRGVISSEEYTKFFENMTNEENDPNGIRLFEAMLRPVFDPIFNLIDDLGAAPVETVLDLLPKLAYMLKTDMLDTQIFTMLEMMGFTREAINGLLSGLAPDMFPNGLQLTTEGIYELVAPLLKNITVSEAVVDEEGKVTTPAVTISITLDKDKFVKFIDDLGGCGDAVVKNSVAVVTEDAPYRLAINSDKADALVVFLRWLYDEVTTEDNLAAINTLIDTADLDSTAKVLIKAVLGLVASNVSADDVIVLLVNLLAPATPDIGGIVDKLPDVDFGDIGDKLPNIGGGDNGGAGDIVSKVVDAVKGLIGGDDSSNGDGGNGGSSITDNPSVPKTGGEVAVSLLALAVAAATISGACILKRKDDDEQ